MNEPTPTKLESVSESTRERETFRYEDLIAGWLVDRMHRDFVPPNFIASLRANHDRSIDIIPSWLPTFVSLEMDKFPTAISSPMPPTAR